MIRAIVTSVVQGVLQRITASGRAGEVLADREFIQDYGYTSRPKAGAEVVFIREGNHFIAIASDDRRYRIALEEGEVALYTDEGDKVHLKRGRVIDVVGGEKVIISTKVAEIAASTSTTVTSPEVTVVASTKVTMSTPLLELSGDLTVGGTAAVTGALSSATSVADPTGTMQGMRNIYNAHHHPENGQGGGTTSTPNEGM